MAKSIIENLCRTVVPTGQCTYDHCRKAIITLQTMYDMTPLISMLSNILLSILFSLQEISDAMT